jgi:hypothetical protein
MGIITRFIGGAFLGAMFVVSMDDLYYRVLKRNIGEPVQKEFEKDKLDVVQVTRLTFSGLHKTYKDLYP